MIQVKVFEADYRFDHPKGVSPRLVQIDIPASGSLLAVEFEEYNRDLTAHLVKFHILIDLDPDDRPRGYVKGQHKKNPNDTTSYILVDSNVEFDGEGLFYYLTTKINNRLVHVFEVG